MDPVLVMPSTQSLTPCKDLQKFARKQKIPLEKREQDIPPWNRMRSNFSEVKFQCRTCYLNTLKKIDNIPSNASSCLLPAMEILPSSNSNKFLHHKITHCFHLVIMWWSQVYSPVHPKTNEIHNDPEKSVLSSCTAGLYMEQLVHIDLILYKCW